MTKELHPLDREEWANIITHATGIALSVAGLVALILLAVQKPDAWKIVSVCVFGGAMIWLYTASTLYHGMRGKRIKAIFRRLDHASIFLLIAGTYTPFSLVTLRGPWGFTLFGIVWGLAVSGILMKLIGGVGHEVLSLILYVGMGWLGVVAIKPFLAVMPFTCMGLVLLGGILYTLGILFYQRTQMAYHHAIWHLFVIAGSLVHLAAILIYVAPA